MFYGILHSQTSIRSILNENNKIGVTYQDYRVSNQHTSNVSGVEHIYLQQQYKGLDIYQHTLSLHIDPKGAFFKMHDQYYKSIEKSTISEGFTLSPIQSLNQFLQRINIVEVNDKMVSKGDSEGFEVYDNPLDKSDDIRIKKVLFAKDNLTLVAAYQIEIYTNPDLWEAVVDAKSGEILSQENLTLTCFHFDSPEEKKGCTQHHEQALSTKSELTMVPNSYNVFPLGVESPIHGPRSIEVNPSDNVASPFGWHDDNGVIGAEYTSSKGNNVEAKDDIDNNNETVPGQMAQGGTSLMFDFPYDGTATPTTNLDAAITNLFYWNNMMHDVWYHHGFDEASGNFQELNYSGLGLGSDYVNADALDGGGTNNANFSTPSDGGNPRMQMYVWNGAASSNTFTVNTPSNIAGVKTSATASFGPTSYNLSGNVAVTDPILACTAINNPTVLNGKIAIINRGTCQFSEKAYAAQQVGAIGVIICQNTSGNPTSMSGGNNASLVTIPVMMISMQDCDSLKIYSSTASVTMFNSGSNQTDSDFDNGVICHEYGHGISNRLTGGAGNASCLGNQEQMGEGWSDWFGLMLTLNIGDLGTDGRGIGNYLTTGDPNGGGIRAFRYSTDLSINPHTYNSIQATNVSVPHGVGSVWCAMLWEVTWSFIDLYGLDEDYSYGTGGNNKAMSLIMEGMKLQPCRPGFIDGRDAILDADRLLFGGAHQCLIWEAFAKRGLGYSALQGSSDSKTDGIEAFDLPPLCDQMHLKIQSTNYFISPGDTIAYQFSIENKSDGQLTQVLLKSDLPIELVNETASNGGTISSNILKYPFTTIAIGDTLFRYFYADLDPNINVYLDTILDSVESVSPFVSSTTNHIVGGWDVASSDPHNGSSHWYAETEGTPVEKYLTLDNPFIGGRHTTMKFWHSYDTEVNWDGGNVYVSTDSMKTWQDLGPNMVVNGYNGRKNNKITEPSFSGNSGGYIQTTIDLTSFKGNTCFIRFTLMSDDGSSVDGWYIDDIEILNTAKSFTLEAEVTTDEGFTTITRQYPPTQIVKCIDVYSSFDNGQGTLRRAVTCSVSGDTIHILPILESDSLLTNTTAILLDHDLMITSLDSIVMDIYNTTGAQQFIIEANAEIILDYLNIDHLGQSTLPTIENNGTLNLKNVKITGNNNSSAIEILNKGVMTIIKNAEVKKE